MVVLLTPALLASPGAPAAAGPAERKVQVDEAARAARAGLEVSEAAARQAQAALRAVEADLAAARGEVSRAQQALDAARARDAAAAAELARAEEELAVAVREEEQAAARVAAQRRLVGERANAAYRSGGQLQEWQVVLDSDDADEVLSRVDYLSSVMGADGRVLDDLTAARVALAEVAARRAEARERVAVLREQARQAVERDRQTLAAKQAAEARVDRLVGEQRAAAAAAEQQRAADESDARALEAESRRLEAELVELARQARERAAAEERARAAAARRAAESASARSAPSPAQQSSGSGSGMVVPVVTVRPSSNFGMRIHPIYGTPRMHNGVDFAAPTGTTVRAATAGRVHSAGASGGAGNMVVLDHGLVGGRHLTTTYMHLSRIDVRPGQRVAAGERIGAVGSTGASTGPHLHFEVRRDGAPTDPMGYL